MPFLLNLSKLDSPVCVLTRFPRTSRMIKHIKQLEVPEAFRTQNENQGNLPKQTIFRLGILIQSGFLQNSTLKGFLPKMSAQKPSVIVV